MGTWTASAPASTSVSGRHTAGRWPTVVETERGDRVVAGDGVCPSRDLCGHDHSGAGRPLTDASGSAWDRLEVLGRIHRAAGGDLDRPIVLHDAERGARRPIVREIENFRVARAS